AIMAISQHALQQAEAANMTLRQLEELLKRDNPNLNAVENDVVSEARRRLTSPAAEAWDAQAAIQKCVTQLRTSVGAQKAAAWEGWYLTQAARRELARGQVEPAADTLKRARAIFEAQLLEDPNNPEAAYGLANALLQGTTAWSILRPTEMHSQLKATLNLQSDGSILASGEQGQGDDTYTIIAPVDIPHIVALRLEVLPDPSLPSK